MNTIKTIRNEFEINNDVATNRAWCASIAVGNDEISASGASEFSAVGRLYLKLSSEYEIARKTFDAVKSGDVKVTKYMTGYDAGKVCVQMLNDHTYGESFTASSEEDAKAGLSAWALDRMTAIAAATDSFMR